jgi:nucleolar MIF4G domain-containing protein 1
VVLLQRNVAEKGGEEAFSVRARFMMEAVRDLKNNRGVKGAAGGGGSVAAEHTTKMRKVLGTLSAWSAVRATEPLRVTLADLRESGQKGKWWVVGASWRDPAKVSSDETNGNTKTSHTNDVDAGYESETPGHTNLTRAARAQGMNTDIRRLIFVNIVGADDYQDAWLRLQALKLKTKQQAEIPRVLLHCVGVEEGFNLYYAALARKISEDGKVVRKGFQYGLWDTIKKVNAGNDGEGSDDEEAGQSMGVQKTVNLAKFFSFLVAGRQIPVSALKTLDFALLVPGSKAYIFAEVLLTTLFTQIRKDAKKDGFEVAVRRIFEGAAKAPQMIQGLQSFLRDVVSVAGLAKEGKEGRVVKEGCGIAVETLSKVSESADAGGGDSESDTD